MTQFARPTSDIATDSWTTTPLWSKVDESVSDDSDFIQASTSGNECEVAVGALSDPSSSSNHVIRWRRRGTSTSLVVKLVQGTTVIATAPTDSGPGSSFADTSYTLSDAEADAITNYADLRIRFTLGANVNTRVSQCYFECPDAAVIISCGVGGLSLGGQAATVVPGAVTVEASAGALSLGGQSASVVPGEAVITATVGALALGGQAAQVLSGDSVVQVAVAGLSLAGQGAAVLPGEVSIAASAAVLALAGVSGQAVPGAVAVEVSSGVLALGGQGATVVAGEALVAVSAGLLSLGGQTASVIPGGVGIPVQVGSLSLDEYAAQVLPGAVAVGVQVGGLSLEGWDAAIVVSGGEGGFEDHVLFRGTRRGIERRME